MRLCRGREIALDVARGIFYLHVNHTIHLDIKARPCTAHSDASPATADLDV